MEYEASQDDLLALKGVYAGYSKKQVLHDVSLTVGRAEIVTIIGPNGAGKSTILRLVIGLLSPSEGKIYLDNVDVAPLDPRCRVKLGVRYLPQGGPIFPNLTVKENLEVAMSCSSTHDAEGRIDSIFDIFPNLRHFASRRAGLMSGGEKQMLALGLVLAARARLILLDEPSAGLSPSLTKELLSKIKQAQAQTGLTVLLVEQNIKEALTISDRVYLLKEGRVIGQNRPTEIELEKLGQAFFA